MRQSFIGRALAAVLALGFLVGASFGQLVDSEDLELTINENDAVTFDNFATVVSTLPTDTINFALSWDTTQFNVQAFKGAAAVADPTAFTFEPGDFDPGLGVDNFITILVFPINDDVAEADPNFTLQVDVTSTDGAYDGDNRALNVTIIDDDTAGITLTESGGSTDIAEGGATDTYDLVLTSEPTADVTIDLTLDAQVSVDLDPVVFTPGNWNIPQTVTVTAVNDAIAEGAHVGSITHTVTSTDGNYDGFVLTGVIPAITDNDTSGILLSVASVNVTEGGATATFDVELSSQPLDTVTINLAGDTQVSVDTPQIVFDAGNFDTPVTVTVTAIDDDIDEASPHAGNVAITSVSTDGDYDGANLNVAANVTDDDAAGVTVAPLAVNVAEGGATATYDVVLDSEPTGTVTINIAVDTQVTTDLASLEFTDLNWDVPQTVTVTAVDDDIDEANSHAGAISHTAVSADGNYNAIAVDGVSASITDDDTADIVITETGGATDVTEGGATDSYTIVLTSEPTSTVTVTITPDAQVDTDLGAVVFNDTNWDTPRVINVQAFDDQDDEASPHNGVISHTAISADINYDGLVAANVTANVTDNDEAAFILQGPVPAARVENSGLGGTIRISLATVPANDVDVTVMFDAAQVTVNPAMLTITSLDFNNPAAHEITVTPVPDAVIEGDTPYTITVMGSSLDGNYNNESASVDFTVEDDDVAEILVTGFGSGLTMDEAAGPVRNYTVELAAQPQNRIVVNIAPDVANQLTVDPARLVFDPTLGAADPNGVNTKNVSITAINDEIAENFRTVTLNHTVTGAPFNQGSFVNTDLGTNTSQFDVDLTDDDTAAVIVTESDGATQVTEGGATDTYTVVLGSEPTADVTVTLNNTDAAQIAADTGALVFTPANWNVAQTVTVSAVDDALVDGNQNVALAHAVTSADLLYNGQGAATVTVAVADNDTGGVTIVESDGATAVAEGGATDTYTVVLDAQPASDVVITLTSDGQLDPQPATLTFTTADWNVPQTVTVNAVDDNIVEGELDATITHTARSTDAAFDGLLIADVIVTITDNDAASILVDDQGGVEVNEAGPTTDNYIISLGTLPTGTIQIAITPDNQTRVSANGTAGAAGESILVSLSAASPAVTVSVTAIPDELNEGQHFSTIEHSVAAATDDPSFAGLAIDPIVATVLDVLNDSDFDGLTDDEELAGFAISVYIPRSTAQGGLLRRVLRFRTDPFNADSDGDMIRDFDEVVTFARFANDDGSVPGIAELDASAARQVQTGDATRPIAGIVVFGPGQEAGLNAQLAFRAKRVWGVRTLASNDFLEDDEETQETLALLEAAGLTISGADTDGDGIGDADDPAPQFNPALFGVEDLPQEELLDFDVDRDGFPELGEGFPEISETGIEATRGIDYSNDGTLTDGFDFGEVADSGSFRVIFSDEIAGLIGDGQIQSDLAVVDTCPDEFNPDLDGDGIQDENPCQDAPAAVAGGCCGTPLGFSLMLPVVWTVAARRGKRRRM